MYVCLSPILNLGLAEVFRSAQYLNPSTYAKHAENKLKCNICFCCTCRQSICILMNAFNVQLQCYMFRYPFKYLMVCRQKEKYQILPKLSFKSKHTWDFMFLKQFILLTTLGTSWEPAWMAVPKINISHAESCSPSYSFFFCNHSFSTWETKRGVAVWLFSRDVRLLFQSHTH